MAFSDIEGKVGFVQCFEYFFQTAHMLVKVSSVDNQVVKKGYTYRPF
jgi:hypothetical protein